MSLYICLNAQVLIHLCSIAVLREESETVRGTMFSNTTTWLVPGSEAHKLTHGGEGGPMQVSISFRTSGKATTATATAAAVSASAAEKKNANKTVRTRAVT